MPLRRLHIPPGPTRVSQRRLWSHRLRPPKSGNAFEIRSLLHRKLESKGCAFMAFHHDICLKVLSSPAAICKPPAKQCLCLKRYMLVCRVDSGVYVLRCVGVVESAFDCDPSVRTALPQVSKRCI